MGRPIRKSYFGSTNTGFGGEAIASVVLTGTWTSYTTATTTVAFSAPQLPGGVTATGTPVIAGTTVTSVTVTNGGSGYTTTSSITLIITDSDGGAETTGTYVITLGNAVTNVIAASAWIPGGVSAKTADIVRQEGSRRYRVTTADGAGVCKLVTATPADGEMRITATDSDGGTYYVKKLTARKAVLVPGTGTQFAENVAVSWNLTLAVANVSVKVGSN